MNKDNLNTCWQCYSFDRESGEKNLKRLERFENGDFYAPPRRGGICLEAVEGNSVLSEGNWGVLGDDSKIKHVVTSQSACNVRNPNGEPAFNLHPKIKI